MGDHNSWEVVDILHSQAADSNNAILSQTGDVVSGEVAETQAIHMTSFGSLAIPAIPDAGVAAAEAVVLKNEGGDVIVGGRDIRSSKIAGLVKPGEHALYADGSQAVTLMKNNGGTYVMTTHDNTEAGKNVYFSVEPILDGSKGSFGGFRQEAPWGFLRNDQNGLSYFHTPSGVSFDFGAASFPGPLASFGSYATITAQLIRLNGSAISLGTDVGAHDFVVKATPTVAVFSAIQAALQAQQLAIDALVAVTNGNGSAAGPAFAAQTAVATAATAVTGALLAISSLSVTVT